MRALEGARRGVHFLHVQALGIEAGALFKEGIAEIAVVYFVDIFFFYTASDRIEIFLRLAGREHGDIRGQIAVERERQLFQRDTALAFEVGAVAQRVHARIRAAAAGHMAALAHGFFDRLLQRLLDGDLFLLRLPAVVAAAVVGQSKGNVLHRPNLFIAISPARKSSPSASAIQSRAAKRSTFMRVRPSPPW